MHSRKIFIQRDYGAKTFEQKRSVISNDFNSVDAAVNADQYYWV